MRHDGPIGFALLHNRRSKSIFLARVVMLALMITAVAALGLSELAQLTGMPVPTSNTAVAVLPPKVDDLGNKQDASGLLTEDTVASSEDGFAVLRLSKGTKAVDGQGRPAGVITARGREVPLLNNIAIAGMAYEFGPAGTLLDPPAPVTISFDTEVYYPFHNWGYNFNCKEMHMAFYGNDKDVVPWLQTSGGLETHSLTAEIDHLGTLIIFCETRDLPYS